MRFLKNISLTIFTLFLVSHAYAQTDSATVAISRFEQVPTNAKVVNIHIDDKNVLWLATNKGLIETVGDGSKYNTYFENLEIIDVISDKKDNVWVATKNAIIDFKNNTTHPLPVDGVVISDITYLDGSVWVGTNDGLFQLNTTTKKYFSFDTENSKLASTKINFVHADKEKILWIGTDNGYVRIDGKKWDVHDKKFKMLATCENKEGQWIISEKDMFLISKYNRLFPVRLDPSQYQGKINNFVLDSKGRIYIASDILVRYDPYKEKIDNYTEDAGTLSKACLALGCDKNDNIWIGTDGAGFYKLLFGDIAAEQLNAVCLIENQVSCADSKDGSIKVNVSGGAKPYQYKWNKPELSGSRISSLSPGLYIVTISDKNSTTVVTSMTLAEPQPVVIEMIANNRVVNPDKPDGSVIIKVTGGSPNYTYKWSNGLTTQNLTKAASGQYKVTVTDKNGCSAVATYNVKREKFIPDLEISKVTLGQKLRINDLNFAADSSSITRENFEILEEVYDFLVSNPNVYVEIGGHTNTIPSHEYSDQLSTARARKVAEFLHDRGIPKDRVSYKGYGKREPLTESTSLEGRMRNQRVEIKILSI